MLLALWGAQEVAETEIEAAVLDAGQNLGKTNVVKRAAGIDAAADFLRQFIGRRHDVGADGGARDQNAFQRNLLRILNAHCHLEFGGLQQAGTQRGDQEK